MSKVCGSAAVCPYAPAQQTDGCPAADLCPSYTLPGNDFYTAANTAQETGRIIDINANKPHVVSEVICVKCGKRWIAVRPEGTLLKELECPECGAGYVMNTGERME